MEKKEELTVAETASLIGVTTSTVYSLVKRGKIKKYQHPVGSGIGGRHTYFMRAEIETFLRGEAPAPVDVATKAQKRKGK